VVAYEYQNRPLVKFGAYGAAAAIALSRYSGRNHFLSDIVLGSALGFYTGRFVYRTHHISTASPVDDDSPPAKQTTRLMPLLTPTYNARTRAYGATAVWTF
jgi:membrane-associated phospholipid phosphatase